MIKYTVEVYGNGGNVVWYNEAGEFHCEHGPAIEWTNGGKSYYLNNVPLTKESWEKRLKSPCSGKVVEYEGVKYKLEEV